VYVSPFDGEIQLLISSWLSRSRLIPMLDTTLCHWVPNWGRYRSAHGLHIDQTQRKRAELRRVGSQFS